MNAPLSLNDRLARTLGQLVIAVEEKAAQLDQMALHIQQLEKTIEDLQAKSKEC